MSSIPERNGTSRLDEIMLGVVGVDMLIEWFVYCIHITVYVLQVVGVAPPSFRIELPGLFTWPGFIVSWRSGWFIPGHRKRLFTSSATWCHLNTSCHYTFYAYVIIQTTSASLALVDTSAQVNKKFLMKEGLKKLCKVTTFETDKIFSGK